ncbi:MAG: ABC transporter permease [Sphaerochaetaceae bacterium]|jgi:ribose/xylose/arabinose/galactoside ABC-type transport system permease subunit|nr:ABC transporter permease [Sphaerochaetaceae bacterium]MDD4260177.1 ABC transporter permease [Sphaerochaetaceae bacterium]MDD4762459.1 ABC transporter permease [Sphaerochaetaceae bacterium]MDD4842116.1 ABC transporter permease [Sphaerochaetaceae bacterium]NLO60733.1 ABC transporter permease [Spirochaetales bacterium]
MSEQIKKDKAIWVNVKTLVRTVNSKYFILYAVIALIIILTILSDSFLSLHNIINILRQSSMVAIIAVGVFFAIVSGGIDISVGSTVGLAGVIMAKSLVELNLPIFLGIIIGLAVGTFVGLINGLLVAKRNIPPFVATLGTMGAVRGLTYVLTNAYPVSGLPKGIDFIGRGYVGPIPVPIIIMLVVYVLAYIVAEHTRVGRFIFAIGGNEEAAHLSGIKIDKYRIFAYMTSGGLAALSGIILVSRLASGQPNAGLNYEFEAITSAVVGGTSLSGGKGTILGVLFGALFISILLNGMVLLNISSYYQQMLKGIVLILAVMVDVARNKGH